MCSLRPRLDIPPVLNALWWGLGASREATIAISNTADEETLADVFLDFQGARHKTEPLEFDPHETKVLSINKLLSEFDISPAQAPEGGITIIGRSENPALIAQGRIIDPETGFSTTLNFLLTPDQRGPVFHASGVPIGTPSQDSPYSGMGTFAPHAIVRNLSGSAQSVTVIIDYPGQEGRQQFTLPPVSLAAYTTQDISLDQAMTDLPLPLPYCSIRIQYSGPPGSAIAEVSSVEQREDLVVDSRLGNEGDRGRGSGNYPWHLDDETESIFFLTNMGDNDNPIVFQIQAGGVRYSGDLKLGRRETQAINIRKLRDDQKADFQGNKIPAGATDGCVRWVRIGSNAPVMGRVVVINARQGMASNYNCSGCCGPTYWNMEVNPSSAAILVGGTQSFTANAVYQDCNGFFFKNNVTTLASWTSSSPSVATVSGGTVTGQGGGSATITVGYSDCAHWDINPSNNQCECTIGNISQFDRATVNVQVLGSLAISVTSTPVSGETNSVVSGQAAQVQVQALDNFGSVFTSYTGTVHFSSGDLAATLPADYTFTGADAGTHTFNVTLNTVAGTSATRDLTVRDNATGISATQNINVWFQVTADLECWKNPNFTGCSYDTNGCAIPNGSYYCTVASGCGPGCTSTNKNQPQGYSNPTAFMTLPYKGMCGTGLLMHVNPGGASARTSATVGDIGPGSITNNYWNSGAVPSVGSCLSDQLMSQLSIPYSCSTGTGSATIQWRFGP